jgi:hypothetical protein
MDKFEEEEDKGDNGLPQNKIQINGINKTITETCCSFARIVLNRKLLPHPCMVG